MLQSPCRFGIDAPNQNLFGMFRLISPYLQQNSITSFIIHLIRLLWKAGESLNWFKNGLNKQEKKT